MESGALAAEPLHSGLPGFSLRPVLVGMREVIPWGGMYSPERHQDSFSLVARNTAAENSVLIYLDQTWDCHQISNSTCLSAVSIPD